MTFADTFNGVLRDYCPTGIIPQTCDCNALLDCNLNIVAFLAGAIILVAVFIKSEHNAREETYRQMRVFVDEDGGRYVSRNCGNVDEACCRFNDQNSYENNPYLSKALKTLQKVEYSDSDTGSESDTEEQSQYSESQSQSQSQSQCVSQSQRTSSSSSATSATSSLCSSRFEFEKNPNRRATTYLEDLE